MAMKKKGNANGGKKRMMKAKGGMMGKRMMKSKGGMAKSSKVIKGPYS